jgi:hypothetical protein
MVMSKIDKLLKVIEQEGPGMSSVGEAPTGNLKGSSNVKRRRKLDKTGPEGKGPKTGRGLGICKEDIEERMEPEIDEIIKTAGESLFSTLVEVEMAVDEFAEMHASTSYKNLQRIYDILSAAYDKAHSLGLVESKKGK